MQSSYYTLRAVLGIDFDYDAPIFRPYEKPYQVDWDKAPSILGDTTSKGYLEAVFKVDSPPIGKVTDRLCGYFGKTNPPYNEEWMKYPRTVIVILPSADSQNMAITSDSGGDDLEDVTEVKYYAHRANKYRDIQLIQTKEVIDYDDDYNEITISKTSKATWKVGENYEFRTKNLIRVNVQVDSDDASRDIAFASAEEARRNRRLLATLETNESDIYYSKDMNSPNTYVVVVKNEKGNPYSGQIIRINLGDGL